MTERFEDKRMPGAIFSRVDLGGARFEDANLGRTTFENVNLTGVTIQNANLAGLSIEDADIKGMTIDGIRIDDLIEAEQDRRDPERVRLRIQHPADPEEVRRVMHHLDGVRAEFFARLRTVTAAHLNHHSGPEAWSALEHMRHLLFAEDMYLNRWILRNDRPWCRLGHLPPFLVDQPGYADVGTEPTESLDAVLTAWDKIHAGTRDVLSTVTPEILRRDTSDVDFGQGTVGHVLRGMAQHDLAHIRMAEAALQRASRAIVSNLAGRAHVL